MLLLVWLLLWNVWTHKSSLELELEYVIFSVVLLLFPCQSKLETKLIAKGVLTLNRDISVSDGGHYG